MDKISPDFYFEEIDFSFFLFLLSKSSSWGFHANITHERVEQVLKQYGIHGNYVCRRSQTTPGSYTLSVR